MNIPICRFCLEDECDIYNPLLCPCQCKGSAAYVHKTCIRKWRRTTQNPHFLVKCQMCLTKYKLPNMNPMENLPEHYAESSFLRKSYFSWLLLYVQYIIYKYWITRLFEYWLNQRFYNFSRLTNANIDKVSYLMIMNTYACIIVLNHCREYIHVRNKQLYLKYWLSRKLSSNECESPIILICASILCYIAASYFPSPFYIVFIMLLVKSYNTHIVILNQINYDNT